MPCSSIELMHSLYSNKMSSVNPVKMPRSKLLSQNVLRTIQLSAKTNLIPLLVDITLRLGLRYSQRLRMIHRSYRRGVLITALLPKAMNTWCKEVPVVLKSKPAYFHPRSNGVTSIYLISSIWCPPGCAQEWAWFAYSGVETTYRTKHRNCTNSK